MVVEKTVCGCCETVIGMRTRNSMTTMARLVLILALLNLPSGFSHIASVIENDGTPGSPLRIIPRGPTVPPAPPIDSPDKLDKLNTEDMGFFNPAAEAIRNLLSRSSPTSHNIYGLKRVSQFHGNGGGIGGGGGADDDFGLARIVKQAPYQNTWDDEDGTISEEDEEKPTFVPFIGARALTNIPEFFGHLRENIEALKLTNGQEEYDDSSDDYNDISSSYDGRYRKDFAKPPAAARRVTQLSVDDPSNSKPSDSSTLKQSWKPRAAGIVQYYAPKSNFLEQQQSILRRANNYNPAWLYTNLGLGKKRR